MKSVYVCWITSLSFSFMLSIGVLAQVGIGTTTPNSSAMLDVSASDKGLLIPRLTALQKETISFPATGLLIYQTDDPVGFYYNSGTPGLPNWENLSANNSPNSNSWNVLGNGNTDSTINFLGTTDTKPVYFKTNNTLRLGINSLGKIETYNTGQSLFIGQGAGKNDDLNNRKNVFLGDSSGTKNISGYNNTSTGYMSLYSNSQGYNNTAFGYQALYRNTVQRDNTAFGYNALSGVDADGEDINGSATRNTALGSRAMAYANVTGNENTAVGYRALANNSTGNNNVAIGNEALSAYANFQTGSNNTAIGYSALSLNTSGDYNIAIGYDALAYNIVRGNTTGTGNIGIGFRSLSSNVSGNYNIGIGHGSNVSDPDYVNSIAIGYNTGVGSSNTVRIGNSSITSIGGQVGWTTFSDRRIKKNIREDVKGLDFIKLLHPVSYQMDIDSENEILKKKDTLTLKYARMIEGIRFSGFIAQEVIQAANKVGYDFSGIDKAESKNGLLGLRYSDFVVPLVKAVQEQQIKIENLEKEIEMLKNSLLRQK